MHREGLRNQEELFDRFYIDVGTNAFVLTSRIRQAMLAVQIFVQRCLMGLERQSGVEPHQIDIEEWKIISRHAVWAARGKALLYPEELLNPAWRDNKSPAFKSFEAALQQGDVTPANAELGYRAYLDAFTAVASLEVCGTYLQEVFEGREQAYFKSVLHVIARSRGGANRSFFYRRLNRYEHHQEWTSWEAVDLDIQSVEPDRQEAKTDRSPPLAEAGVHVLPVVFRGQLYLFWPVFVRKIDQLADEPTLREGGTARFSKPYWEIKIAWSRKSEAGWSPKQQSGALFETWWWWPELQPPIWDDPSSYSIYVIGSPDGPKFPEPAEFVLKAIDKGQSLEIAVGHRTGPWGPTWRGTFSFSSSTSELKFVKNGGELGGDHFTVKAPQASPSFMGFRAKGEMRFVSTYRNRDGDVLMSPPNEIRVVTLNQVYGGMFAAPMFFDVGERSYFARSSLGANTIYDVISEPQVKPGLIDVQVWDPTVTGSILASEKRERHPWVIASKVNAAPYVGALIQSAANLAIKTWPSHLEPVGERSLTLTAQQPDPMIEVLLPMPLPFPYLFPFQTFKVKALNVDVLPFHHPFADLFSEVLRRDGLQALLSPDMQKLTLAHDKIFKSMAKPNPKRMGAPAREGVDFDQSSAYGNYNWELFFHAPAMLAQKLSDNAQYEAAIDLIRKAIYTPFAGTAEECWRFQGLRNEAAISLETMLQYLSLPDSNPLKQNVLAQIDMTRLHPFQAHRVARLRPLAYKKWIVAFDVRQHLAMGDAFFRRFTPEDVNQAIQYYMIAHRQMGPKPEVIKQRATLPARSYAELRPDLDAMGNVMFAAESKLSGFAGSTAGGADATSAGLVQRGSIGYFGIPKNEKLLGLWDEVADRLFKIRNGMNIDGIQIQLPLFSPPIDPALLAEAAAAGVDLANLAADLTKPLPNQRYQVLYHRAIEYAETVLRLGDALLAARERQEGESLQARRAANERDMATFLVDTRKRALDEATANRNYIAGEEETWKQRWMHYANLLGIPLTPSLFFAPFTTIPARKLSLVDADKISFEALSVVPDFAKVGLFLGSPVVGIGAALSDTTVAGVRQLSTGTVLQEEKQELESAFSAVKKTFDAAALDSLASVLGIIPNFEAAVKPLGAGAAVHLGGQFFALAASATARHKRAGGDMHNFVASVYRKQADLVLRERGWVLELNSAANEVQQARRRLAVADIQVDLAQRAVDAQSKDLDHATSIETLLRDKFTTAELYDWAEGRLRQLYKQCFEMALESAKMAEACYRFEREEENSTFIRVAPPANAREELVAGYELLAGLRNMNNAYGAAPRLSEFTRNVSLRQADPYALEDIRNGGTAEFTIPELIFQIDHPSYYDRRIKTVEVTIPCVAGPNSPVTGTLTLQKSRRRRQPKLDGEVRETVSGASIPLSSGRSDNGLFVLSMDDPLYLPFEGMGIDTDWKLELPAAVRHFDYRSIADVVLTIRYTAKRGGGSFPAMVSGSLKTALNTLKVNANAVAGPYQLFSLRHDLPTAWHALKAGDGLAIVLTNDMLPFMLQNLSPKLEAVEGVIRLKSGGSPPLSFSAPVSIEPGPSGAPAWKLPLPPNAPPELQNATEITDITLFARYSIDD